MTDGILFAMIGVTKAKALNPSGCGAFFYLQKGGFIMKMRKKKSIFMSLVLSLVMLLSLTGCGSSEQAGSSSDSTSSEKKVLKVGMECMNAPYNWSQTDDSNGAVPIEGTTEYVNGYDVMMAKKIAEENGYELQVYKIEWDGLIMAVQSGTINAIIAGMSATDERKQSVDFSDPYYKATHVLIVKKDSKYASAKTLDDLKGCNVTSQQGTTMYDSSAKQIKGATIQEALPDIPSLIVAVSSGRTDVAIVEKPMALAAIATNKDLAMVEFPEGSGFDVDSGITNIAVAAKKGNSAVVDACNKTLKGISDEEKDKMMKEAIANQPASDSE